MNDLEFIQTLKEQASHFSDEQLLHAASIVDEAYKRNFCQLYEPEDFAEEFVDNFLESLNNLPPEIANALKEKILEL